MNSQENQYRALFEQLISGYALHEIICDHDGKPHDYRFLLVNPAFESLFGRKSKELIGKKVTDVFPDFERSWIVEYGEVALTGKAKHFERYFKSIDKHIDIRAFSPERGKFAVIFNDTTERRRTEGDLKLFHKMIESSQEAIAITDPNGSVVYVNPAHERLFKRNLSEAKKANIRSYFPPESIEVIDGLVVPRMSKGESWEGELDAVDSAGMRFPIWQRTGSILDSDGNLCFGFAFMHNISEQRKAHKELLLSEARLRQAQKIANVGSFSYDFQKEIFWLSEQLFRICSLEPTLDTVSRETILQLIHTKDYGKLRDLIVSQIESQSKQLIETEARIVLPVNNETRYLLIFLTVTFADNGAPTHIDGTVQDITERKRADNEKKLIERQLRQSQKLESLGVLAGGIAHDFNNLLMTILGNADLALHVLPKSAPPVHNIAEIEKAAQRAAELCKQMLAYSGKGKLVTEEVNLNTVIRDMSNLVDVSVSKKAAIHYHLDETLPLINADISQIRQLVMNLIVNASDALEDKPGIITISTGVMHCDKDYFSDAYLKENLEEGGFIYLDITDTGCGMDRETQVKIFDPFFTTKFAGRGLGLAAVLGIVRGHNGAIKIYSEKSKGTTFKAFFPCGAAQPVVQPPVPQSPSKAKFHGKTILLADDDESVRQVGKEILEVLGFRVIPAENGRLALELFKKHQDELQCVLLDLTMPELDGEEVFREIRKIKSNLPVILSSGYNEGEATQRFEGRGLAGFIQKPYRISNLKEKLEEVLTK